MIMLEYNNQSQQLLFPHPCVDALGGRRTTGARLKLPKGLIHRRQDGVRFGWNQHKILINPSCPRCMISVNLVLC